LATRTEHLELQLEQTEVMPGRSLVGTALTGSRLRAELGLIIVAHQEAARRHDLAEQPPRSPAVPEVGTGCGGSARPGFAIARRGRFTDARNCTQSAGSNTPR
jgi:hypothetical protein